MVASFKKHKSGCFIIIFFLKNRKISSFISECFFFHVCFAIRVWQFLMDSLFIRERQWTLNFFRDDTCFEGVLVIIHPFHNFISTKINIVLITAFENCKTLNLPINEFINLCRYNPGPIFDRLISSKIYFPPLDQGWKCYWINLLALSDPR